jgi:hypothetical protein
MRKWRWIKNKKKWLAGWKKKERSLEMRSNGG